MRYEISEEIGDGVFLAHDRSLDRRVALRFFPENLQNEAKSAATLDHPYICKIYEIGEQDGKPFIAMEYVRGETLERRLARGALPPADVARIGSEIAEALETAHEQNIVHRDLKPSNIMLTEGGHVKVMNFGLGKMQDNDPHADILSLGAVLNEMVAGNAPEPLQRIIEKMSEKAPEHRYQRIQDMRADLARLQERPVSRQKSKRWLIAVAMLPLLVLATWLVNSLLPHQPPSVAVLPFKNVSEDPIESDYLAQGITRAVITKLTQTGLQVTPWETAQRYGDRLYDAESIADELHVGAVLMGTFELVDNRIVTTLSLVDGETGLQSWADELEEPFEDIFRVQRRIATGAATSLKRRLTGEEEAALAEPESRSVDAYDFYLQGAHIMQDGGEEATTIASEYFARALELDPDLAEAYVGLGAVHNDLYYYGWGGRENLEEARANFEKALELKPVFMRARTGLCWITFLAGQSEACLVQAQEAGRFGREDDVETVLTQARGYRFGGLPDRGPPLYRRAIELDPANEEAYAWLTIATWGTQESVDVGNKYFRLFGDYHEVHYFVAEAHQILGNEELAREHYEKAMEAENLDALVFGGILYDRLGETERAHEAWRKGIALIEPKLEAYPDNTRMRLLLACFYGLLGDRASMIAEEEAALANDDVSEVNVLALAAVEAGLGEIERAVELNHRSLRLGMVAPFWIRYLQLAAPELDEKLVDEWIGAHEAASRRLQEIY